MEAPVALAPRRHDVKLRAIPARRTLVIEPVIAGLTTTPPPKPRPHCLDPVQHDAPFCVLRLSRAVAGAFYFLDFRHRICYGARGQDGFGDATREEERRRAPHRGEVVPIGSLCEQRRTCWGSERLHFAPGPQPFFTGRARRSRAVPSGPAVASRVRRREQTGPWMDRHVSERPRPAAPRR